MASANNDAAIEDDAEIMDGEDDIFHPPPNIAEILDVPAIPEEKIIVTSSDDGGDNVIPAIRERGDTHVMTLRASLPPPGSYSNTFEKEFQYV